ncbi:haloacid dehalogenase, type II [Pyronema domesticum]|uniref:Similar to (S)-2-haloacid dehalogenase acc. no. Q53464 n=1 Tax=Pyronema omphalodes (strain CBS 100304) TaxID=1076935 RepID=U4LMU8_PYROM|nr:haloacid dehalogenase, type II [Pyronema domesticum]CCX33263.1 Similar to (S)-2-haloacid dehalogenase; acc. no. Q53464 [Pyronema omphalodes CBS 100304]
MITLAFDLYGTLLDTSSISTVLSLHLPASSVSLSPSITALWRQLQLEYTFRLTSSSRYLPFPEVTRLSLLDALARHGCSLTPESQATVMAAYSQLTPFPDVSAMLARFEELKQQGGEEVRRLVFSNGAPEQLERTIRGTEEIRDWHYVSVHETGKYKPAGEVYGWLCEQVGRGKEDVVLVSGNPFDVVGAEMAGVRACWVDRAGKGWTDGLGRPTWIISSLEDLGELVGRM